MTDVGVIVGGDEAALATYRATALDLADAIRGLMHLAGDHGDDAHAERLRSLLARLAEDRFNLAVMGQFSRGKSTLMNAVLGFPHLPMGALPMTAVVTTVAYGDRPTARIHRGEHRLPAEVAIDDLARYIAQSSDERAELDVELVELTVPAEILRLGFAFIDTPGVGSSIVANTATTERLLPDADAVVFVTGFDSPLTAAELEFLAGVRQHVKRVFVVVNKRDLVSDAEAADVLHYVRARLGDPGGDGQLPSLFAVSALQGLEAKLAGDPERLRASGLPELEAALVSYLTTRKAREFLLQTASRVREIAASERWALTLGRQGPSRRAAREALLRVFDQQVATLSERRRRITDSMLERVAAARSGRAGDTEVQRHELRELLEPLATEVLESFSAADRPRVKQVLHAVVDRIAVDGERTVERWAGRRARQTHEWAQSVIAEQVRELERLRAAPAAALADALGIASPPDDAGRIEGLDLPALALSRLPIASQPSPGQLRLGRGRPDRLADSVAAMVERTAEDASTAFDEAVDDALRRSIAMLSDRAEAALVKETRRLRSLAATITPDEELEALDDLEHRVEELHDEVHTWQVPDARAAAPTMTPVASRQDTRLAACEVCRHLDQALFEYLAHQQNRLATRPATQSAHAETGGYCPLHTWDHVLLTSELGVAAAYAALAARTAAVLVQAAGATSTRADLAAEVATLVQQFDRCPVCRKLAAEERSVIGDVVRRLRADPDLSPALCVGHLAGVLRANLSVAVARRLVADLGTSLAAAAEDMRSYSLKREALRNHLLSRIEQRAHNRVVARLAGSEKLARVWVPPDELF